MESCDGLMELSTRAFGRTISIMVVASSIMQAAISMKVNLLMIWHKALGSTNMPMEVNMWAIGIKISNMVLGRKSGMT
jgi:hypothetical protein